MRNDYGFGIGAYADGRGGATHYAVFYGKTPAPDGADEVWKTLAEADVIRPLNKFFPVSVDSTGVNFAAGDAWDERKFVSAVMTAVARLV